MRVQFSQRLPATPEKVYATLLTPAVLQRCIEGCESLTQTGPDTYDAKLRVSGASMKGTVKLTSAIPAESLTLEIQGKGLPGSVKATVDVKLSPSGDQTALLGVGEVTVGGFLVAVGSKLLESGAQTMIADFFAKLSDEISTSGT